MSLPIEPITQIVGGVGLLLAGVLNLVGNLLSGLGLDSVFRGILGATVRICLLLCYCADVRLMSLLLGFERDL